MDRPECKDVELAHGACFGLAEQCIVCGKGNVAHPDQIEAAGHAVPVDHRNRGLTQMEEPHPAFARQMKAVPRPDRGTAMRAALLLIERAVCIPEIGEFLQIIARAEMIARSLDDQDARLIIIIQIVHHHIELVAQLLRQRIAGVRTVERQGRDPVLLFIDDGFKVHGDFPSLAFSPQSLSGYRRERICQRQC